MFSVMKYQLVLQILFSCIILVECMVPPDVFVSIIRQLKMTDFVIQHKCFTFNEKSKYMKLLSGQNIMISFNEKMLLPSHSLITCTKNIIDLNLLKQMKIPVILVITQYENEIDLNEIDVTVDNAVYFIDKNVFKFYEAYKVNHVHVTRYLGNFYKNAESVNVEFFPADDYIDSFVERRGNFYGLQLVGMVEQSPSAINNFPNYLDDIVHYFSVNDTYDLTDIARGSYRDVLNHLEKTFNFSTKLYKRKDGFWGYPKIHANGSTQFTGMLKSIVKGSADLICSQYGMVLERLPFLDFLPAITNGYVALFIAHDNFEIIDWTVLLMPFSIKLWICICISAISFMVIIKIIERQYSIETTVVS